MRTHNNTIINMKKKNHPKLSQFYSYGIFCKGSKNEFETSAVNEQSVFELLKFYCISSADLFQQEFAFNCSCEGIITFNLIFVSAVIS